LIKKWVKMTSNFSNWARFNNKWTRYSLLISASESTESNAKPANTILILPGNPGNDGFYIDFATALIELWKKECQVYILGHLNHVPLPRGLAKIDDTQLSETFNLEQQICHSAEFVREIVEPTMSDKKIRIIGHSIGSYIGAAIKPYLERDGFTIDLIGLFPTFVNMAQTPAGLKVRPYANFIARHETFARVSLWGLRWLPIELKRLLVRLVSRRQMTPAVNQASAELVDSLVFRNVAFMASNELNVVNELKPKMQIELSSGNVHLYYGVADDWVPLNCAHEMAELIGKDRVIIDDTGAEHAFVLKDSLVIAEKVVKFLA